MAIREGRWDCPSCGSTGIYGRHVECPGCGKPRPAGIRFYLTDDAPVLRDAAQLREAKAGPDWVCEHCAASNRATVGDCGGCGAPRGSSPGQRIVDYPLARVPRSGGDPKPVNDLRPASDVPPPPAAAAPLGLTGQPGTQPQGPGGPKKPANPQSGCVAAGCLTGLVGAVVFVLFSLIGTCTGRLPVGGEDLVPATVTARRWERSFLVEQRRVVNGTGWDLPDSAEVVRTRRAHRGEGREVDHYESVTRPARRTREVPDGTRTRTREVNERVRTGERTYVCGQRDLGNGYFEDIECTEPVYKTRTRTESYEEPVTRTESYYVDETVSVPVYRRVQVYDTFFTYRVPTWDSVEVRRTRGDAAVPSWPDTTLRPAQRITRRRQEYWMTFQRLGGRPLGTRVEYPVLRRWNVGQPVALRIRRGDRLTVEVLPADSLAQCRRWHQDRRPPPDSVAVKLGCSPRPPSR